MYTPCSVSTSMHLMHGGGNPRPERKFCSDNLLVRIHLSIVEIGIRCMEAVLPTWKLVMMLMLMLMMRGTPLFVGVGLEVPLSLPLASLPVYSLREANAAT